MEATRTGTAVAENHSIAVTGNLNLVFLSASEPPEPRWPIVPRDPPEPATAWQPRQAVARAMAAGRVSRKALTSWCGRTRPRRTG